jgi:hypothetical protein
MHRAGTRPPELDRTLPERPPHLARTAANRAVAKGSLRGISGGLLATICRSVLVAALPSGQYGCLVAAAKVVA